jgi:ribose 5-phosphate isomerase B
MAKTLITETSVTEAIASGKKKIEVPRGTIVTPLASELATKKGVQIVEVDSNKSEGDVGPQPTNDSRIGDDKPCKGRIVAIGSDHGGYQLKEQLKKYIESLGYTILDVGTSNEDPCDYPDFAYAVAKAVATGEAWRGIMIDGAGIGSCVVANKVPGVKAACCHNEFVARNAREHNDTNVLTLGSRVIGSEVCKEIVRVWLETWFAGGRHKQRVDKITDVERRYLK